MSHWPFHRDLVLPIVKLEDLFVNRLGLARRNNRSAHTVPGSRAASFVVPHAGSFENVRFIASHFIRSANENSSSLRVRMS